MRELVNIYYRPKTKLREGNVFTGVCLPQWKGVTQHALGQGYVSHHAPEQGLCVDRWCGQGVSMAGGRGCRVVCVWTAGVLTGECVEGGVSGQGSLFVDRGRCGRCTYPHIDTHTHIHPETATGVAVHILLECILVQR